MKIKYNEQELTVRKYQYSQNESLYLGLYDEDNDAWPYEEELYADITVNLPDSGCYPANFAYVDVNNFPEAVLIIEEYGLGKPTGRKAWNGFSCYPQYEFDLSKIN